MSRSAVERVNGRLKNDYGLIHNGQVRTRGIERVRLHATLTILTMLAVALAYIFLGVETHGRAIALGVDGEQAVPQVRAAE